MKTSADFVAKAPYCSWGTFEPILSRLKARNPTTVTLEVLMKWQVTKSNAMKALPALRFLQIIDADGNPNEKLWQSLTSPQPEKYKAAVREMMESAYSRMLEAYATAFEADDEQLAGYLAEIYATAPPSRKPAVSFIRGLMKEAGMAVSASVVGAASQARTRSKPTAKATPTKDREREENSKRRNAGSKPMVTAFKPSDPRQVHIHIHVGTSVDQIDEVIKAVTRGFENALEER